MIIVKIIQIAKENLHNVHEKENTVRGGCNAEREEQANPNFVIR